MILRLFFSILSIAYIAGIFLWADSPVVSDLAPFNPYSLLHIPLYGILTILLIFSFFPLKFKRKDPNDLNDLNASSPIRFIIPGVISLIVAIADEIHQSFIPTRDASILDVFLDFVGIVLVLFLVYRLAKDYWLKLLSKSGYLSDFDKRDQLYEEITALTNILTKIVKTSNEKLRTIKSNT